VRAPTLPGIFFAGHRLEPIDVSNADHAGRSAARSSMASSALIGTNNFLPIFTTGNSPRLAAS